MKSRTIKILALMAILLLCAVPAAKAEESPWQSYTYTRSGDYTASPMPFLPERTVRLMNSEGQALTYTTDFFVDSLHQIWVADNGSDRIALYDRDVNLLWSAGEFFSEEQTVRLNKPYSITEDESGNYYITDEGEPGPDGKSMGQGRIIKLSANKELLSVFTKPEVDVLGEYQYFPMRMAADESGRMYVIARNVNQGFMQLNQKGEFEGFIGAPPVKTDPWQVILRLFSTKEQKKRMMAFVPTEYSGVDMNADGFLYATVSSLEQSEVSRTIVGQLGTGALNNSGVNEIMRLLNPAGDDILQRKGGFSPLGDIRYPNLYVPGAPILTAEETREVGAVLGSSRFIDIKAGENGVYFVLDSKRNRVFAYDGDSVLLFAFGGAGGREQSFSNPVAIEYDGSSLYVLSSDSTLMVCAPTQYGTDILEAVKSRKAGGGEASRELWEKVLAQNTNCEPAYDALGRLFMDEDDYKTAMQYFKASGNRYDYSRAFNYYRNQTADRYFLLIIAAIIAGGAAVWFCFFASKRLAKRNGRTGSFFTVICQGFGVCIHPFDRFYDIKYEKKGSFLYAAAILFLLGASSVLKKNNSSFIFNYSDPRYTNVLLDFSVVVLPYLLFAVANWCLTTLMDGKGGFKDIVTYVGYAVMPLVLTNFIGLGLSFALSDKEAVILSMVSFVGMLWSVFLIFAGTVSTHDYSAGKAAGNLLLTLGGIVIIVFIALFFIDIVQQVIDFVKIIFKDLSFR